MVSHQNELQPATLREADSKGVVSLAALQVGVTVIIPWSELFAVGHHIAITLGGIGGAVFLKSEHIGKDIEYFFPGERLIELHGRQVGLHYLNINLPTLSPDKTVYEFEAALYHPVVDAVIDGVLPWDAVESGYTIKIPVYPEMAVSDTIRLFLACPLLQASKVMDIPVSDTNRPIEVHIGNETSRHADGGDVYIVYQVVRGSGVLNAPPIHFKCASRLPPPMPTHLLQDAECYSAYMDTVENGAGYFEFFTTPGAPLEQSDEAFLLVLSPHSRISAIAQAAIEQSTAQLKFLVSKETISYLANFRLITVVRSSTITYSSGMSYVSVPSQEESTSTQL